MSRWVIGVTILQRVEVVAEKFDVDKIVQSRDGRHCCPRCLTPMKYVKVIGKMAEWSPAPYVWRCPVCPPVVWHDGTIKDNDNTWDRRLKNDEAKRISSYISVIFKKKKT